jgi:glutaredoxin 3
MYILRKIRTKLNNLIQENPVLFLSFETCPYCVKAKAILDSKNAKYTNIDLRNDSDGKAIRAELGTLIGRTSVPAIFINQQYVGGCNDGGPNNGGIVSLQQNGQLDSMLQQAGAI